MNKQVNFKEISVHDVPDCSPGFLLWQISTSWRTSIEAALKQFHLTHPQFVILASLGWLTRNGERVTQAAIGKMARLDPNTTSQIIRGLEQKGWIQRESSSDGRAKNPILTSKGKELLVKALPVVEAKDALFFRNLTDQETDLMIQLFQKLEL